MRKPLSVAVATLVVLGATPAGAEMPARLIPPVDGPISRAFEATETEYGRGHRGLDYAVAIGTRVRTAASGTVTFAGDVAGTLAVTVDHGGGVETTYTGLSSVDISAGDRVSEGTW